MCKSHFMIMIHSEWCLLWFTCLLWDEPAIYVGVKRRGGGGGLAKTEKKKTKQNKIMHKERRRKNWYARKHGKTFMQVSPISGICITGILEKKFSYF